MVVSEIKPSSLEDYERALYQFQSYFGDPTETLAATVKNDPEFVMGHVFNASAMLMMSERQYIPAIRHSIGRAESLSHKSNDREKELIMATRDCLEGRWDRACVASCKVSERCDGNPARTPDGFFSRRRGPPDSGFSSHLRSLAATMSQNPPLSNPTILSHKR